MLDLKNKLLKFKCSELFINDVIDYIQKNNIVIDIKSDEDIIQLIETVESYLNKKYNTYEKKKTVNDNSSYVSISMQEKQYNGDSFDVGGYSFESENNTRY